MTSFVSLVCDSMQRCPTRCRATLFTAGLLLFFAVPYTLVLTACFPLIFRLLLQSAVFWNAVLGVIFGYTLHVITKRLGANYPTQPARILKAKTIPPTPHPQIQQKTICWLELLDEDEDDLAVVEDRGGTQNDNQCVTKHQDEDRREKVENNRSDEEVLAEIRESRQELLRDLKAWAHVPCVLLTSDRSWKEGDVLTVSLIDGDPTRPLYVPFQLESKERMKKRIFKNALFFVLGLIALHVFYGNIVVANFQDLEDSLNEPWSLDWLGITDDDDGTEDNDKICRIPPYVTAAYDVLILVQIAIPLALVAYILYKRKKLVGLEEPSADSYQLLRGDEDFDDEAGIPASDGGTLAPDTNTDTRMTPEGQCSAVVL